MQRSAKIVEADLQRPDHQQAVLALTEAYAADPMGGSTPLSAKTRERLISGLRDFPTTVILLAYLDDTAVGMATCFRGFSTFSAQQLLNLHDLVVRQEYRSYGIGRQLLEAVEQKARELGCCKTTLEVGETNAKARRVYEAAGFEQARYGEAGGILFYSKTL